MKKWFLERFLPMWAKQTVLADNRQLHAKNDQLCHDNRELRSYIRGLEFGVRQLARGSRGGKHADL